MGYNGGKSFVWGRSGNVLWKNLALLGLLLALDARADRTIPFQGFSLQCEIVANYLYTFVTVYNPGDEDITVDVGISLRYVSASGVQVDTSQSGPQVIVKKTIKRFSVVNLKDATGCRSSADVTGSIKVIGEAGGLLATGAIWGSHKDLDSVRNTSTPFLINGGLPF